jgi:RNA-directed DNA polymerase
LTMSLQTPPKIRNLQRKLYVKAKAEPAYRFYLLYDKIYRDDVLRHAYALVRSNAGAPGVDGQVFADIESAGLEEWLAGIRNDLKARTYRPQPVRRVMIPKPGGGERPLGIPTIRDRCTGTAAKLVLEPIFEADLEPSAYGYRPKRSAADAIRKVHRLLCDGYTQAVDADLSKYFDTIPHSDLLKCVARRIVDRDVLHLIRMWLKAPVEVRDQNGKRRWEGGKKSRRGVPQGGTLSTTLANLYIAVSQILEGQRPRTTPSSPCRCLRRRSRHPQPHACGRSDGLDEGGDDPTGTERQRGQDLAEGCNPGTLRLPGL